jgi:hypothetical protein
VQGTKNGAADALFRHRAAPEDSDDDDADDHFDPKLHSISYECRLANELSILWVSRSRVD